MRTGGTLRHLWCCPVKTTEGSQVIQPAVQTFSVTSSAKHLDRQVRGHRQTQGDKGCKGVEFALVRQGQSQNPTSWQVVSRQEAEYVEWNPKFTPSTRAQGVSSTKWGFFTEISRKSHKSCLALSKSSTNSYCYHWGRHWHVNSVWQRDQTGTSGGSVLRAGWMWEVQPLGPKKEDPILYRAPLWSSSSNFREFMAPRWLAHLKPHPCSRSFSMDGLDPTVRPHISLLSESV